MTTNLSTPVGRLRAWLDMHLTDHGVVRTLYNNFYDLGGGMYRCSQPSPAQIRKYHRKYGIRSIINLRGPHEYGSYAMEQEVCAELGIALYDLKLFSRSPPSVQRIHALDELFSKMEYPALMHCKSGADRAGVAAALYRILRLGHPVERAMKELGWKYGHFKGAKTGVQDFFFAAYLAYNARKPMPFMEWVNTVYDERAVKSQFREEGWASLIVDKVLHRE